MACTPLTFHPRCGKYVRVTETEMTMERTRGLPGYTGALTTRQLTTSELATIEFNEQPLLTFGVTTLSPEKMPFPLQILTFGGSWCLTCYSNKGNVVVNGATKKKEYITGATLKALRGGGTLGLLVTKERELIYYVNGQSVGVAASNIPEAVYVFVEPYLGSSTLSVKLISALQEKANGFAKIPPAPVQEEEDTKPQASAVREIAYSELEIGDSLGVGGQGAVFQGQWKTSTRKLPVAIKRVLGKIRDEEAEILSRLSHPNVITFYGVCTDRYPEYFIITEFAELGSLYALIHEKHCHPDLEERLQWAKEIAEGMRYLHQEKVIHRDLKSHNVLLTASRTVKLCDFGSAKEFDHTTIQTGTGTYRWIAPEVLKGEQVSLSCDVFSYGMVLFEIFAEEVPFAGIHDIKVANMILEGKTPAIPLSLEPYLANLMKCCWQMSPKARPSFMEILVVHEKKECAEPEGPQDTTDGGPAEVRLTPSDLPHLQRVLEEEASMVWYPLGMKLQLDSKTLAGIATASGNDVSTALSFMLTRWLKSKDHPPLLRSLTAALCSPEIALTHISDALLKDKDQFGQK